MVLSLDPYLEEAYSIGRRHPGVPLIAGFEKEDKKKILRAFPTADYMICSMECTTEQRKYIEEELKEAMKNRFRYHYAVIGLLFILMRRPFYQKGHYTCSSYMAKLLEEAGICSLGKHFSLVTPKDFYEYEKKEKIFEGRLSELVGSKRPAYTSGSNPVLPAVRPAFAGTVCMRGPVSRREKV